MTLLLAALLLQAPAPVGGDPPGVRAMPLTEALRVDGALDEAAWASAPVATGFRQREPREGEAASESTEVRVLYNRDTLYVGVSAHDREPGAVIGRILERDKLMEPGGDNAFHFAGDDAVAIILDPFQDRRSAFLFATNPSGAEFDALITDESPAFNVDWRGVWRVAARRTADGWTAEFAIPFRTLRYPEVTGEGTWGFNVERMIRRKNEDTLWSAWSRAGGGLYRVSRAGRIEGLRDLRRSRFNIEVKPYGLAGVTQERAEGAAATTDQQWRLGADGKWEIHPGLVFDGTVNPDFAQVEADAQVVNLTRFELYFPEKRDFFLENAGIFDFGTRGAYETPPFLMFFSRRIGLADGTEIPVRGGVRLSGRAGRQTVGLLDVVADGVSGGPRENFAALRLKRDLGARSYVGAMLTDRRSSDGAATDFGADTSLWLTSRLNLQAFAARTSDVGGTSDSAYRAYAEYGGDPWYFNGEYLQIGPKAATAMGFVTRSDMRRTSGKGQYTLRPSVLGLRRVDLYVGGKYLTRVDNEPQDGNGFAGFSFETNSGETLAVTEVLGFTVLDYGFALADRIPIAAGRSDLRDTEVSVTTSAKRPVWGYTQVSLLDIWNGRLSTVGGGLQVRGGSRLSLAATYTRSEATMPAGAFVAHVPGLRLGWTQTTRLTVATYLQYNSLTRRFIGNFRLDFIHHPGSDLFVVFNEERGTEAEPWSLVDRGFAVKLNYLIRF